MCAFLRHPSVRDLHQVGGAFQFQPSLISHNHMSPASAMILAIAAEIAKPITLVTPVAHGLVAQPPSNAILSPTGGGGVVDPFFCETYVGDKILV